MKTTMNDLQQTWVRKRLFWFFLNTYMQIVVILLVFSIFSYFVTIKQINDNVKKLNLSLMNNISSIIDQRLIELERTSHRLTSLGTTIKLSYMEESNEDFYYEMTKYVQNLWTLWLENDSLAPRMYVYFARSGILAATDTFYNAEDFYGRFFTYADLKAGEFYSMLLDEENNFRYFTVNPVVLKDQADLQGTFDMLVYNYHLKKVSSSDAPGAVFFLIDTHEILKMLDYLEIGEGGLAVILDAEGNIVAKLDNDSGISNEQILSIAGGSTEMLKDRMVISLLSDKKSWKYLSLGSHDVLMKPVGVLRQALIILLAVSVFLASVLSLWMARKRSLPLFKLACRLNEGGSSEIEKSDKSGSGYRYLEYGVNSMLQKNVNMQEQLQEIHPMLIPAFIHRLFGGGFADDCEVAETAARLHIFLPSHSYRLISFFIPQNGEMIADPHDGILRTLFVHNALQECLDQLVGKDILIYQMRIDEIIWIYSNAGIPSDESAMLFFLDKIVDWLNERHIKISIRFSRVFNTIANCWWEYEQIRHTHFGSDSNAITSSNIELVWHDPDPNQYHYMLLVEPILSSMFRTGDERMLNRLLEIVKKEIFETSQLDSESRRMLVRQLRDVTQSLTGVSLDLPEITGYDLMQVFETIRITILNSCHKFILEKNESGSFLIRKIHDFTDQQLYNPLLSMTMIADKMKISGNYLSRVFKEKHGDTLANYIEKKRIQTAQDLLRHTMMSVSDIAVKVGYYSDHVFRRAFRRVTGLSPIEYRQGTNDTSDD